MKKLKLTDRLLFWWFKRHPERCDHRWGSSTKGYRTLYCDCCGKETGYVPVDTSVQAHILGNKYSKVKFHKTYGGKSNGDSKG